MQVEFCKGTEKDRQDILDFADMVFSKHSVPHDFTKIFPKHYGEGCAFESMHYLVKEDGKIRALVCVVPMEYQVGDTVLKVNGLGTVSVHPVARGKGYMKKLMQWALEDMEKNGDAFSVLGGQRQRYEYFGYIPAGVKLCYDINGSNLRHRYAGRQTAPVEVAPMAREEAPLFWELYQRQSRKIVRSPEDFFSVLCSWQAVPYALRLQGEPVGYFTCAGGKRVQALVLSDATLLPDVLQKSFDVLGLRSMELELPPWDLSLTPELGLLAEDLQIRVDHNYRIFNLPQVAEAFLKVKASYTPLPEGALRFSVSGQTFTLEVKEGNVLVSSGETPEQPETFCLSPMEAAALLFTPEAWRNIPGAGENPLVRAWFPLPLYTGEQDNC